MRICFGALAMTLVAPSIVQPVEAFPTRNIELIIPYAPGGGFDIYARAVGQAIDRHLPAGLRTIPKNIPGAGTRLGTSTMYRAEPDGHVISIVSLPGAVEPHVLDEKVAYDLDRVTWLGAIDTGIYALVAGRNSAYQSWPAVQKADRPIFVATGGGTDLTSGKIVAEALKLNFKFLTGYKNAPDALLAVERGEGDIGLGILNIIAPKIDSGALKPLLVFQHGGPKASYPELPNAASVGKPELAALGLYRAFAAPPNLPPAVGARLIELVWMALNDPYLKEWSAKSNNPIAPETAEQASRRYAEQKQFLVGYKHLLVQASEQK